MSIDIYKNGYMPGYEVWVHHGEDPPPRVVSKVQSHEEGDYDRWNRCLTMYTISFYPSIWRTPIKSSSSSIKLSKSRCTSTRK
jgi:hypothetical protein